MENYNTVDTVETTPSETATEETTATEQDLDIFAKTLDGEEVDTTTESTQDNTEVQDLREEKDDQQGDGANQSTPQTFTLKHNGAEFSVTQEQIIPLAQKGMDYDRIREQRDSLLNDPTMLELDEFAKAQGMSRNEFLNSVIRAYHNQKISMMAQDLMQDRGLDEQTAQEMAELHFRAEKAQQLQQQRQYESELAYQEELMYYQQMQENDNRQMESFSRLMTEYPELSDKHWDELPEQMRLDITKGVSPIEAYQRYLLVQNQKELNVIKNNNNTVQRATGNTRSQQSGESDVFLDTLFGR